MNSLLAWHRWPCEIPLPDSHRTAIPPVVLIQIPGVPRNPSGREKVRETLRCILSRWMHRTASWIETERGPVLQEPIQEKPAFVSISYAEGEAWLGLALWECLGVDAVSLKPLPDWEEIALLYLGVRKVEQLRKARNPAEAFAFEWAAMEASLKRVGLPLSEHQSFPESHILTTRTDHCGVAVAVSPRNSRERKNPLWGSRAGLKGEGG